jgi:hypothetical protein
MLRDSTFRNVTNAALACVFHQSFSNCKDCFEHRLSSFGRRPSIPSTRKDLPKVIRVMDALCGENHRRHSRPPTRQRVNPSGLESQKTTAAKPRFGESDNGALQWKSPSTIASLEIHCQKPGASESYKASGIDTFWKSESWPREKAAGTRISIQLDCTDQHRSYRGGSCVGGSHVTFICKATRCSSYLARCLP